MPILLPLTGLRGLAAYSVLLAHALNATFIFNGVSVLSAHTEPIAYFGMSLFFVLSGFVIHYNYAGVILERGILSGSYRFLVARFARLYPLFFVLFLLSISYPRETSLFDHPWLALAGLTLTQSWFNGVGAVGTLAGPSWSISTETAFYVVFLIIVLPLARIRRPILALVLLMLGAGIILLTIFGYKSAILAAIAPNPWVAEIHANPWMWLIYYSPYVRVFEFLSGVMASKIYRAPRTMTVFGA